MIVEGRVGGLVLLVVLFAVVVFIQMQASKKVINIRKIAGLDVVDEFISRAVEMGRPVFYTSGHKGSSTLYGPRGASMLATVSILNHIARKTARLGAYLKTIFAKGELHRLADVSLADAYKAEDKIDEYKPEEMNIFLPDQSYGIGTVSLIESDRPAAAFILGTIYFEAVIISGSFKRVGTTLLGSSATLDGMAFLAAFCDYILIGEELFAASAYLSNDKQMLASLAGQDYGKIILLVLIVVGVLLVSFGVPLIPNLLKM